MFTLKFLKTLLFLLVLIDFLLSFDNNEKIRALTVEYKSKYMSANALNVKLEIIIQLEWTEDEIAMKHFNNDLERSITFIISIDVIDTGVNHLFLSIFIKKTTGIIFCQVDIINKVNQFKIFLSLTTHKCMGNSAILIMIAPKIRRFLEGVSISLNEGVEMNK